MGTTSNIIFEVVVDGVRVTYVCFRRYFDRYFSQCGQDLARFLMRHSAITSVVELSTRFMVEKLGPHGADLASFVAEHRGKDPWDLIDLWDKLLEEKAVVAVPPDAPKKFDLTEAHYQLTTDWDFAWEEYSYRVTERASDNGHSLIEISAAVDEDSTTVWLDMKIEEFALLVGLGRRAAVLKPPYPSWNPALARELAEVAAWWHVRWTQRLEALVLSATRRTTTLPVSIRCVYLGTHLCRPGVPTLSWTKTFDLIACVHNYHCTISINLLIFSPEGTQVFL